MRPDMDSTTPDTPIRRYGYTRRQPTAGEADLMAQRQTIRSAGTVDGWFHDDGIGCEHPLAGRPQLGRALDVLRPGDVLAIASIDRIGSDLPDLADILHRVDRAEAGLEVGGSAWAVDPATVRLLVLHTVLLAEARAGRLPPAPPGPLAGLPDGAPTAAARQAPPVER